MIYFSKKLLRLNGLLFFAFLLLFQKSNAQCLLYQQVNTDLSDTDSIIIASSTITANSNITGAATITFQAGNSIQLLSGFHATNGVDLTAKIANCPGSQIEIIANIPKKEGLNGKSRNIWDLQIYQDKLYIGYGSTTQNTGPTELWAFNPATEMMDSICTIATEAIERFRVWNDTLFIPNADPTRGDLFKFTYLVDNTCHSVSISHSMAHVRDIYFFNGQYYLIGNTRCPGSKEVNCAGLITITDFNGTYTNTWLQSELLKAEPYDNSRWNWFFGLMEVDGQLVIPNAMFTKAYNPTLVIKDNLFHLVNQNDSLSWSAFQALNNRLLHPYFYPVDTTITEDLDTPGLYTSLRIFEHEIYQGKTLYALRTYSMFNNYYQSQYNNSAGLMIKDALLTDAKKANFPAINAVGEDLKIINGQLHVLANERISANQFNIYIYTTTNPTEQAASWTEVLQFNANNMARSFEYYAGYFYFGLGFNQGDEVQDAGQLIRLKKDAF